DGLMGIYDPTGGIKRIVIFREANPTRDEVRRTVLHEIAHHFGMHEGHIRGLATGRTGRRDTSADERGRDRSGSRLFRGAAGAWPRGSLRVPVAGDRMAGAVGPPRHPDVSWARRRASAVRPVSRRPRRHVVRAGGLPRRR